MAALIDGRTHRRHSSGRDQDPRLLDLIQDEIASQRTVSTGTWNRVITRITLQAKDLGIPIPTSRTLYRLLAAEERDSHAFGDATSRRTQDNRPSRTYGRRNPLRPDEQSSSRHPHPLVDTAWTATGPRWRTTQSGSSPVWWTR